MTNVPTKECLSPDEKRLVELMQWINYGWIKGLEIRDGNPVLDPRPHAVRVIKLGADNSPRPEREADDFALKKELIEFFVELHRMRNGTIERVEIRHGLPFLMEHSVQS